MIEIEDKYAATAVFTNTLEASAPGQIQALCDQAFVQGSKICIVPERGTDDGGRRMTKNPKKINKTERILSIYHLLRFCREVSIQELENLLPGCRKTFSRDIALLKSAGVQIRYSARQKAFVCEEHKRMEPDLPESRSGRRFVEKLIRLFIMMDEIPDEDCDRWYAITFPDISKRTMQRDFATLNSIGYKIRYERSAFNCHDAGFDLPPRRYYCDRPNGAYDLIIS